VEEVVVVEEVEEVAVVVVVAAAAAVVVVAVVVVAVVVAVVVVAVVVAVAVLPAQWVMVAQVLAFPASPLDPLPGTWRTSRGASRRRKVSLTTKTRRTTPQPARGRRQRRRCRRKYSAWVGARCAPTPRWTPPTKLCLECRCGHWCPPAPSLPQQLGPRTSALCCVRVSVCARARARARRGTGGCVAVVGDSAAVGLRLATAIVPVGCSSPLQVCKGCKSSDISGNYSLVRRWSCVARGRGVPSLCHWQCPLAVPYG
jgi:hypothetical protein